MRAVIQRVYGAELSVDGELVSRIGRGLVVYLGVVRGDSREVGDAIAAKIARMRIFEDEKGKMNYSVLDLNYEVLLVSQFTLCADCSRGNRPDFLLAEAPEAAKALYLECGKSIEALGITVKYGVFGADMTINQVNAGPVTIVLEKD